MFFYQIFSTVRLNLGFLIDLVEQFNVSFNGFLKLKKLPLFLVH